MELPRPYDRAHAPPSQVNKSIKQSPKRGNNSLTVVTRVPASPEKLQQTSKATKYPSLSSIVMDDDTLGRDASRRSSRRVELWLDEQQGISPSAHSRTGSVDSGFWQPPTPEPESSGSQCTPALAYLNLAHRAPPSGERGDEEDCTSVHSFIIVEEAETPTDQLSRPVFQINGNNFTPPATPNTTASFNTSMSVPARLSSPGAHLALLKTHQTPTRNVFRRLPVPDASRPASSPHSRVTFPIPEVARNCRHQPSNVDISITPKASRYRLRSLTNKTQAVLPSTGEVSSPRASTSTSSAATSTLVDDCPAIATKLVADGKPSGTNRFRARIAISLSKASQRLGASYNVSQRSEAVYNVSQRSEAVYNHLTDSESSSKGSSLGQDATTSQSTFSSSSLCPSQSELDATSFSAPTIPVKESVATLKKKTPSIFKERSHNLSSSTLGAGRGIFLSSAAKKKKLVVRGIARGDGPTLEGLKKWCETFGELREISRLPNGDLLVDFKRADVAEKVCRLEAQVLINGVGSVALSWYKGKKP